MLTSCQSVNYSKVKYDKNEKKMEEETYSRSGMLPWSEKDHIGDLHISGAGI